MNRHLRNLAAISLGVAVCAAANLAHAQSMDALYEKAKLEKELIIYGGGPASLYEGPARAFEQKYPGIKVTIHADFSNVLNEKINQQIKSKKLDVDLAILQTAQDYIRWKKETVLARFEPAAWKVIDKTFKDRDGFSQARIQGQDDFLLSARRRHHAFCVLHGLAALRLGLDDQVHGQWRAIRPGPPRRVAQPRVRREHGIDRLLSEFFVARAARRQAGRDFVLEDR